MPDCLNSLACAVVGAEGNGRCAEFSWRGCPPRCARPLSIALAMAAGLLLAACAGGGFSGGDFFSSQPAARRRPQPRSVSGQVKVGLILPLSARAAMPASTAQSMRNAAELALSRIQQSRHPAAGEGRRRQRARRAAGCPAALDEGAEIILGPLFAHSVAPVGQLARARGIPVIAFSTDANVAARGVYLLSFLPESDVERIVGYAAQQGKRSYAAAIPDNAYGTVVEAAFKQAVARRGGAHRRARALHASTAPRCRRRSASRRAGGQRRRRDLHSRQRRHGAAGRADAHANGVDTRKRAIARQRPVGGSADLLQSVAGRRLVCGARSDRLPQFLRPLPQPIRPGPGAHRDAVYDAVALVAALAKTQGQRRFPEEVLTNTPASPASTACSASAATAPISAACGDAGDADRRADHQPGAALVRGRGRRRRWRAVYAARSATTASSTGNPAGVTRRRPSGVVSTAPSSRRISMRARIERRGRRAARSAWDRCPRRDAAPSAGIRRPSRGRSSVVVGDDAVAERSTRISQASGRFSVAVAWRSPSMSRRPCAPGPMPAYSCARQ